MGRSSYVSFAALVASASLMLVGCGDDGTSTSSFASVTSTTSPTTTAPAGSTATTTTPSTTGAPSATTTAAPGAVIEITVAKGKVDGGGRKQVEKGEPLTLRVTSDVADEVHVHGYDLKVELEAGVPGALTFTPDAAGVFEVELEKKGLKLTELEVR